MSGLNLDALGPDDRAAVLEVIGELERRNIRWPCWGCRLLHMAAGDPADTSYFRTCVHAEPAGVLHEDALRELSPSA
ncbi:hypothetical protein [Rhizobacter fulvus]